MRPISIMSAAAGAALMIPQSALSQVEVPPDGLRFVPTIRLLYDDNMLRQNDDLVTGDKDDLRVTPSVDITFRRQFGLHQLTVIGSLGYDFHQRFEFLDRERVSLQADGDLSVSGYCHALPRARLNFAQSNLSDQGAISGNTQRTQDYKLTLNCEKPYGFFPVASIGYLNTSNSASTRRVFDINTASASAGVGYSKASLGQISLSFQYERFRRPHADVAITSLRDGAENYRVALLFRRHVAPRLSWQAGASYFKTKARAPGIPDFAGMGFEAQAAYTPSQRFSILFDVDRSSRNQSNSGATYIIQTDFALRGNLKLGGRSSLSAGGSYSHRSFKGELQLDTNILRRSDTTRSLFAGYRYKLRSRLNAGVEVRHEWRETVVDTYRYKDTSGLLFVGLDL
jgi:hypothetical protein